MGLNTHLPQKTRETTKLGQSWFTIGGTLGEAFRKTGSAPENHRKSESNSAPKPLL